MPVNEIYDSIRKNNGLYNTPKFMESIDCPNCGEKQALKFRFSGLGITKYDPCINCGYEKERKEEK